jgi:hypothetical protein
MSTIYAQQPELIRNFACSIFPASTFNFGYRTLTRIHLDSANRAGGMCAIQSLGRFDHTKGGHLVIPDLKLLIEFPPGALILMPSSILRHGNTALSPGERRMSMTQYMAGGLHRWYDYQCRTVHEVEASKKKEDRKLVRDLKKAAQTAFATALGMWSTREELGL